VANALAPDVRLQAGQLLKLSISEPYQSRTGLRPAPSLAPTPAPRPAPTAEEKLEPL